MGEARVFRPKTEEVDQLIDLLMEARATTGDIEKPSWTLYVSYLLNKDLKEVQAMGST